MKKLFLLALMALSLSANELWMCVAFSQSAWGGATNANISIAQQNALKQCALNTPPSQTCYQQIQTCKMAPVDYIGNPLNGWGPGTY